ncbi:MAG TPA: Gfo/Idh/MocA family oxidoreductase, partial [Devosia sp.]|nr:Gfo/Idh/MocA family oxidoreductase [Devosia sp.]
TGGGPVFINLIHDIDLLRYLCGEIVQVQALQSNAWRRNEVEETSVAIVRFESGALGTVSVSDHVVAPWSWELTAKENPSYHPTGQFCYLIGGSHGSLELPANRVWRNRDKRSWLEPVEAQTSAADDKDPLVSQIEHFCKVIAGEAMPLVSGLEGLKTLRVIDTMKRSAENGGAAVEISHQQG